ncbi:MAG: hypothetical protein RLY93_05135 [Sumerlaeia bacterium]
MIERTFVPWKLPWRGLLLAMLVGFASVTQATVCEISPGATRAASQDLARGTAFTVDNLETLESFSVELVFLLASEAELTFFLIEQDGNGDWSYVWQDTRVVVNAGRAFISSGLINQALDPGVQYAVGVGWDTDYVRYFYDRNSAPIVFSNIPGVIDGGLQGVGSDPVAGGEIFLSTTTYSSQVCFVDPTPIVCETVIGSEPASNTLLARGAVFDVQSTQELRRFSMPLDLYGATTDLNFFVLSGPTASGPWSLVTSHQRSETGSGLLSYESDALEVQLAPGTFYVAGIGWDNVQVGYTYSPDLLPIAFGTVPATVHNGFQGVGPNPVGGGTFSSQFIYGITLCFSDVGVNPPLLDIDPSDAFFVKTNEGTDAATETLTIANLRDGLMNWSVSTPTSWLSLTPTSGSSTGEADPVDVVFDTDALAPGYYLGEIVITSPEASNSPQTVLVELEIVSLSLGSCASIPGPNRAQGSGISRGAVVVPSNDVILTDFGLEVIVNDGQAEGTFFVLQQSGPAWTPIWTDTRTILGKGKQLANSGYVGIPLTSGVTYAVGLAWPNGETIYYQYDRNAPLPGGLPPTNLTLIGGFLYGDTANYNLAFNAISSTVYGMEICTILPPP